MKTQPFHELLATPLRSGFTVPSETRGTGIKMVNMGELFRHPHLGDVEMVRVTEPKASTERAHLGKGDLLFARRSLTLAGAGRCAIVTEVAEPTTWESSIIRARVDPSSANAFFLFYYFCSPQGRRQMETIVEQVAAAGIRLSELAKLNLPSPPLREQQAIAEVLGALDDKIAANSKLAQNALSLADTTFEATVGALVMSDHTFEMLATVSGGGTPSTKVDEYWNGAVAWATPTDVTGLPGPYLAATSRKITPEGLQACASKLFEPGAILMTSRATIGSFAINEVPTAVNQGFIVVEPNESVLRYWLLHEMRSRVPEFLSWANGATFLELSRGKFKKLSVRLPSEERLARFDETVAPLHGVASAAHSESRTLAATRDALLPHLMSGRLTVRDAEKTVEDLA